MFTRVSRIALSMTLMAGILLIQSSSFLVPGANARTEDAVPDNLAVTTIDLPLVSSGMEVNPYPDGFWFRSGFA